MEPTPCITPKVFLRVQFEPSCKLGQSKNQSLKYSSSTYDAIKFRNQQQVSHYGGFHQNHTHFCQGREMETMVIASFMLCITLSSLSTIQSSRNSHAHCPISSYLSHHNNQLTTNNLHIYNYPHIYFNISHIQNAEDQFDHGN